MLSRFRIILLISALLFLGIYLFGFRWRAEEQLVRSHAALIEAIEDKDWGDCRDLIAPDYGDRWAFDRSKLLLALKDVGSQFIIVFDLNWDTRSVNLADDEKSGSINGTGKISGKGSALAGAIENYAARYADETFTFEWKKQSWLPWDWKLQKVSHPTLTIPANYTPGDLSSRDSLF